MPGSLCRAALASLVLLAGATASLDPSRPNTDPLLPFGRGPEYALNLAPLPVGQPALQLQDLVFAIATHRAKEAHVFASRPLRLVSMCTGCLTSTRGSNTSRACHCAGAADACRHRPRRGRYLPAAPPHVERELAFLSMRCCNHQYRGPLSWLIRCCT